ncbi:MAG: bifunctional oligoribonuclease/PAP phosphatase NrnA [Anaerolineales bacterium]|nr:bifunctional oligoribonuclease/PAP phosphatase NrnA [Anaerolineales bacterium]
MNEEQIQAFGDLVSRADRILIISHIRPDGDAVGSLIGLGLILEELGKEVNLVLEDGVPKVFHHLTGFDNVIREVSGVYDLIIVVDSSDIDRIGSVLDEYGEPDVNIDHHPTNTQFAKLNLVRDDAVATAEIIFDLAQTLSLPITLPAAEALLTGLLTDSLGFRTSNSSPRTLRIAAELQERGANLQYLYQKAMLEKSIEAVRYWGLGLSRIQKEDRLVWTSLSLEDRKTADYPGRDDADLINVLSRIRDTDICLVFVEQTDGTVKISWRSQPGFDVSVIATQFGGGGHKPAAGAEIQGDLERVQEEVLEVTRKSLSGNS